MFDILVRITVGPEDSDSRRTFEVFKGVICFYSGYFEAAFKGRFREAKERAVTVPTEDPLIFSLFRHWIHTRRFYDSTLLPSTLMDYMTIAKLWVFADAHDVPLMRTAAVEILKDKMSDEVRIPEPATVEYILLNSAESSELRKAVLGFFKEMKDPRLVVQFDGTPKYILDVAPSKRARSRFKLHAKLADSPSRWAVHLLEDLYPGIF
jgi:hypothetical protein